MGNTANYSPGDKAEFLIDGEWVKVIVYTKPSSDPESIVGGMMFDRVELILSAKKSSVRPAEFDMPTDPKTDMDEWSIESYTEIEIEPEDVHCFSAELCYQNKPVLKIANQGIGGPDQVWPIELEDKGMVEKFYKDAKDWYCSLAKQPDCWEPESFFVQWVSFYRTLGIPAVLYLKAFAHSYTTLEDIQAKN